MRLMTFNLGLFRLTPLDLSPASLMPAFEDEINGTRPTSAMPMRVGERFRKICLWPLMEPAAFIEERLAHMGRFLRASGADVICLQEIYHATHRRQLIRELRDIYPFHALNGKRNHFGVSDGMMILSRWPLENTAFKTFTTGLAVENLVGQKGILSADIDSPDAGKLRLFNIHCTAGALVYDQESPRVEQIRSKQIAEILTMGDSLQGRVPLVCGDFNMGPDVSAANYLELEKAGYSDLYAEAVKAGKATDKPSWRGQNSLVQGGPDMRIDLVLMPKRAMRHYQITAADITGLDEFIPVPDHAPVPLSDHYPVTVDFVTA